MALDRSLSRAARRILGDLIHAGLEAWLKGEPLSDEALATFVLSHASAAELAASKDLKSGWWLGPTSTALKRVATDPRWQAWRSGALSVMPECRLAYRNGQSLVHGSIDVLIEEKPEHFVVVDFKTTAFAEGLTPSDAELKAFCLDRGFDHQMGAYTTWVKKVHRNARVVEALVYFTSLGRFVALGV